MPSLYRNALCPTCGRLHNFTVLEGALAAGQECDYVCPTTGGHGRMQTAPNAERVIYPPQGSVRLERWAA